MEIMVQLGVRSTPRLKSQSPNGVRQPFLRIAEGMFSGVLHYQVAKAMIGWRSHPAPVAAYPPQVMLIRTSVGVDVKPLVVRDVF